MKRYLSLLLLPLLLAACQANPYAFANTPLDKAHVALSSLEIVQTEALTVLGDPATPSAVRAAIKTASKDATLAAVQLSGAATELQAAQAELIATGGTSARLSAANDHLVQWTTTLLARIKSIQAAIQEAKHHGA